VEALLWVIRMFYPTVTHTRAQMCDLRA